jgi:hypothetical protein
MVSAGVEPAGSEVGGWLVGAGVLELGGGVLTGGGAVPAGRLETTVADSPPHAEASSERARMTAVKRDVRLMTTPPYRR